MISHIRTISSGTSYPYFNMSLEKYLFDTIDDNSLILYLWQNDMTAVLGRNQDQDKAVHIRRLINDGGYPVRRLSGGGAIYQDTGSLNYAFLAQEGNDDLEKQMEVILTACRGLGLAPEKGPAGDLLIGGGRFSSGTIYRYGRRRMHHGTIQISTDLYDMENYLIDDQNHMKKPGPGPAAGAESPKKVKPVSLTDFQPQLAPGAMSQALLEAFETVYGMKAQPVTSQELDQAIMLSYEKIFQDDDWIYGKKIRPTLQLSQTFSWGTFDLSLEIKDGLIKDADIRSDALEGQLIEAASKKLRRLTWKYEEIERGLGSCASNETEEGIISDICKLIWAEIDS